jgi:hypothetical protein
MGTACRVLERTGVCCTVLRGTSRYWMGTGKCWNPIFSGDSVAGLHQAALHQAALHQAALHQAALHQAALHRAALHQAALRIATHRSSSAAAIDSTGGGDMKSKCSTSSIPIAYI